MICAIAATFAFLSIPSVSLSAVPVAPDATVAAAAEPASTVADAAAPAVVTSSSDSVAPANTGGMATAVQGSDAEKPPTPVHTGFKALIYGLGQDVKHLPSKPNLYIVLGGAAAALAVHPIDDDVNIALKS